MFGFITTRPIWKNEENVWLQNLRSELSKDFEILNAPLQTLSLTTPEIAIKKIDLWLDSLFSNSFSGYLIFTSPSSVKAFLKHLHYFSDDTKFNQDLSSSSKERVKILKIAFSHRNLRVAVIGTGTKNEFAQMLSELFDTNSTSNNSLLNEIIHVAENPDSSSFLELFKERFVGKNLLVLEGDKNSPILVDGLRKSAQKVENIALYTRTICPLPTLDSFYNKIVKKNKLKNHYFNFIKQVFLLLSSSVIAIEALSEFKRLNVELNSMIVLSHHDRIIKIIKRDCPDLEFAKISSLNPRIIGKKLIEYTG